MNTLKSYPTCATTEFNRQNDMVLSKINELQLILDGYRAKYSDYKLDWGNVGDMAKINELLDEAIQFIK
jgi:hypothetical protein